MDQARWQVKSRPLTHKVLDAEGRATSARRHGVRILDSEATARHGINEVNLGALEIADADRIDEQPDAVRFEHLVCLTAAFFDHQTVLKARAAATLHEDTQAAADLALFGE